MANKQPALFIPHGGGPCFFMDDPTGMWTGMADFLQGLPETLPEKPKAILVISGHWETDGFTVTGTPKPELVFDYFGFPEHTYKLKYDAPGAPELAQKVASLLAEAGLLSQIDPTRGLDHGVFVPLKVAFPEADIPVVEMSVDGKLDPALHLAAGRALASLREEGVLIVATGMSFHNMRGYNDPRFTVPSEQFDAWLTESLALQGSDRDERLNSREQAPAARLAHPDAEHLLPVMIAAGAATGSGKKIYAEHVFQTAISGFRFD
uniref:Dioxygenase n=1 Tax=Agrobacterium albertimagni TaxID=147266 RepID=A0A7C1P1Q4_9HYPH